MLPGPSTRRHVIFDGTDKSVSFQDFVRRLENSPDWIDVTAFSVSKDIVHVVPTHLYGEALRYYETLDSDCQQDWSQLRDIMARRFPGAMRSGGLIRRSTTRWEEDGLPTMAEAPPLTSSQLVIPGTAIDEPDEPTVPEHGSRPKAKVDLSDPQAVEAAKKAPLITIPSNDDSERYAQCKGVTSEPAF
ncbi:hypothetical protein FRC00_010203 [Tulasnella sp. 408]|nr:hypothetical protein FRC00_010203 [Tulasnella sp. 408]